MPAVNEPTEPKVEMQSLQLTCSLTPSSTEPSTWLVIIWLKRWPARPLIELPLVPPSVGVGEGLGDGGGVGGGVGVGVGVGVGQSALSHACAAAGRVCTAMSISDSTATSVAGRMRLRMSRVMIS